MSNEFRDDLREVVKRHSMELSPDDLRNAAQALEEEASRREEMSI